MGSRTLRSACWRTISSQTDDDQSGYTDGKDWLCKPCYDKFIVPRTKLTWRFRPSLRALAEAKRSTSLFSASAISRPAGIRVSPPSLSSEDFIQSIRKVDFPSPEHICSSLGRKGLYDHRLPRPSGSAKLVSSKSPKSIFDLPGLFETGQGWGGCITVFGNNWIRSPDGYDPLKVVQVQRACGGTDGRKHRSGFWAWRAPVPFDSGKILKETERAIREYKLKGIMINSSVNGEYLDSPQATPFLELVSDLDVPLFIHPPKFTIGNERMEMFRLPEMLGRPFDDAVAHAVHLYRQV